jgi:ABC-2 type transport system permease protein
MSGSANEGERIPSIPIIVVNQDGGAYGGEVLDALAAVRLLEVTAHGDVAEADARVGEGDATAAVIIPPDFSSSVDDGRTTSVRLVVDPVAQATGDIVAAVVNDAISEISILGEIRLGIRTVIAETGFLDGAEPELRRAAEAAALGVIWTRVEEIRKRPLIAVRGETVAGEETESSWNPFSYYAPSFGVMFAFFLVAFMASSLLQERENGLFHRLLVAPIGPAVVVAGKICAYGIIVFLQMTVMFTVGALVFDMPMGGSPIGIILITVGLALAATSLGTMIGALSRNSDQAGNIGTLLGFILMIAGGCIFPLFRAGGIISVVSYLTPHAHALSAYMALMADGATLADVAWHVAALVGFAGVFFGVATARLRLV